MQRLNFPKTIYVKTEHDAADGNDYLICEDNITGLVDTGVRISVGVYKLIEVQTVEGVTRVVKKNAPK